jgi:hypothetical protein
MSKSSIRGLEIWRKAEARFTLGHVIRRVLAYVLLPTCLLELGIVWILVPAWGILVLAPFLVLPTLNLVILKMTGGATTHWKNCEARLQNGKIIVRLPGTNFVIFKPSETHMLDDGRLEVIGAGSKVWIDHTLVVSSSQRVQPFWHASRDF